MITNTLYGSKPRIVHNCGSRDLRYASEMFLALRAIEDARTAVDKGAADLASSLAIVLWNNQPRETVTALSLRQRGYSFEEVGHDRVDWQHRYKLELAIEWMENARSKPAHALFLDANDVTICRSLSGIVEHFLLFQCAMLFNAERCDYPPNVSNEWKRYTPPFKFLNAGAFICNRYEALPLLKRALDFKTVPRWNNDDQGRLKVLCGQRCGIEIDSTCDIFQTICGGEITDDFLKLEEEHV